MVIKQHLELLSFFITEHLIELTEDNRGKAITPEMQRLKYIKTEIDNIILEIELALDPLVSVSTNRKEEDKP